MQKSRKRYERRETLIRPDQEAAIQADADRRYPERHGATNKRRNFSPALRDIIDFWIDHPTLFLAWIASRGQTSQEQQP